VKQAIFHPEARHELIESVAFYEARHAALVIVFSRQSKQRREESRNNRTPVLR
jgi:hypothetical protein